MEAVDYRTLPQNGVEQPVLVRSSKLPGTAFGMMFATLSIVEAGQTFTLMVKHIGPFTSKAKVLLELLESLEGSSSPK